MAILFRVDSSVRISSGHVYRTLSLARQVKLFAPNEEIIYICKDLPGNFNHLVEDEGFKVIKIPSDSTEEEDAQLTLTALKNHDSDLIIIDHYGLGKSYELMLRSAVKKIVVIDDLMSRKHECDILIDQNFRTNYLNCYEGLVPSFCKKFLGPQYSLLREQFYSLDSADKDIGHIQNILVFFSSGDPDGETLRFLKEIETISTSYHFKVLVSKGNQDLQSITSLKLKNCELHVNPADIASLMRTCDFFFGGSGSITWERMAIGLGGAIVILAENQRQISEELSRAGLQYYWGAAKDFDYTSLIWRLDQINRTDLEKFNQNRRSCKKLINKNYIREMVEELLKK